MRKILVLAIIIILGLIAAYLIFTSSSKITITLDSNNGSEISKILVDKNTTIKLPIPTKGESIFLGWYLNDTKVDDTYQYSKNTTLKAQWKDYYTITFDSNGGSTVDSIEVACGSELNLPETIPTKDGYQFISWVDQHERSILDKALLTCDDLTLYAYWEKK